VHWKKYAYPLSWLLIVLTRAFGTLMDWDIIPESESQWPNAVVALGFGIPMTFWGLSWWFTPNDLLRWLGKIPFRWFGPRLSAEGGQFFGFCVLLFGIILIILGVLLVLDAAGVFMF